MKKITKIVSLALVLVMALTMLASCGSKYSAIEKAFIDAGYENNTTFTGVMNTIKEELAKDEYAVELHMLTKKSNGLLCEHVELNCVFVLCEFFLYGVHYAGKGCVIFVTCVDKCLLDCGIFGTAGREHRQRHNKHERKAYDFCDFFHKILRIKFVL